MEFFFFPSNKERKCFCGTWSSCFLRAAQSSVRGGESHNHTFLNKDICEVFTCFSMFLDFLCFRVPDRHTLKQILTTYIHPTESDPVTRQKWALLLLRLFLKDLLALFALNVKAVQTLEWECLSSLLGSSGLRSTQAKPPPNGTQYDRNDKCIAFKWKYIILHIC